MRIFLSLFFIFGLVLLQVGCSTQTVSSEINDDVHNNEVITVYLNDFDDIIGPMFEEATGYKVKLVQGSGAEILSRIEAERGNPRWDVVWVDMISSVHGLGMNDMLYENYIPEHMTTLKDSFQSLIPEQKWYYPTGAHASAVIVYNHHALTTEEAPTSWHDFSNPTLLNSIGVADPTIAAPAYAFVNSFFYQYGMTQGKTMMSNWLDNGLQIYPKNPNVAMALISGQIKVAALQENNAYILLNQQQPISIVWPEEGAPAAVRVAAISKKTSKLEAAQAFINFLLDPATQQKIVENSDDAYHEPSALGVQIKADRNSSAKLVFADTLWSYEHEAEIKQWFADFSVR